MFMRYVAGCLKDTVYFLLTIVVLWDCVLTDNNWCSSNVRPSLSRALTRNEQSIYSASKGIASFASS